MSNPLIRKLEAAEALTVEDRAVLNALCTASRQVEAKRDIIAQGDTPSDVHLVLDGIACRYKILANGARQIVAVLLPGDFCDLHIALLGEMDHTIGALTPCRIVDIPAATIRDLSHRPRIARALWWATLVDEGTLREWLINNGRREAPQRMAHFFCEMLLRLQAVSLADDKSYDMPFRQYDLADLFALTSVHVNRTLRQLREADLIVLERRQLTIPDVARLMAFCDFDPAYLHLGSQQAPTVG
ncbi:Crp/Fnr family transcriptional regulator [Methylobacterium sp. NEAU 140]|uniref:Crp/Fnr family transcriptional regulator n=1 Tax=Methylobacterium sp. NEAU 140 TaxID=3064945 RepID=UPI0027354CFC|nr:Crp/Fnr family transcriptional regulator [Methylobacterium sp. NEAU 140]MDP4026108.1 Crp/Fnr family transcriptional regulator [Methylobacterium sp. NEAU 140]